MDSNRLAWVATTRYATTWLLQRTLLRGYYEARYYGLLLLVTTWYNYVAPGCGRTKRVPAAGRAELLRRSKRGRPGRGSWSWADTSERPPPCHQLPTKLHSTKCTFHSQAGKDHQCAGHGGVTLDSQSWPYLRWKL